MPPAQISWTHKLNPVTRTPTNDVWLATGGAFALGLPYLWNSTAYAAVTSIATIGQYIAYVIPTFLQLRQSDRFERGPWHLGSWSTVVGTIAIAWVLMITVLSMLPQTSPITAHTFNYAPIAVGVVATFCGTWWLISARRWFLNPEHSRSSGLSREPRGQEAHRR